MLCRNIPSGLHSQKKLDGNICYTIDKAGFLALLNMNASDWPFSMWSSKEDILLDLVGEYAQNTILPIVHLCTYVLISVYKVVCCLSGKRLNLKD